MYDALLFLHFLGLALGVGTGFAQMTLALASRELPDADRAAFMLRASALGKNGSVGLLLLLVTGVSMMALRGFAETFAWGGPALHAKLTLVAVLLGAFGYLHAQVAKAKRAGGGPALLKVARAGRLVLFISLGVVMSAVLAFH